METTIAKIENLEKRSAAKEVKLPGWPDNKRGTPNSFLRSALFSAVQSKDRADLKGAVMASQGGITIKYTGEQLNQEDLTLWETMVHLCKESPLGNICQFTAYEILKALQLGTRADDYERLHIGIVRLIACAVEIEQGRKKYIGSLLIDAALESEPEIRYRVQLNRSLIRLYVENTWVDFGQRLQLRSKPLAQFLHGYYSSHKTPYPVTVAFLHGLSGSKTKALWKFKQSLSAALDELVKIDFLKSYLIEDDLVRVEKA